MEWDHNQMKAFRWKLNAEVEQMLEGEAAFSNHIIATTPSSVQLC